jgi:DNA topoisomerase-2
MSNSKYVKLDHRTHVLKRSETYVGSKVTDKTKMYVIENNDLSNIRVVNKDVQYNPAFIKLFDEILTNASDHSIRTGKVKMIKILVDDNKISVENDGPTVPIELHPEENVYNPELIFGHLLTGENYDDTQDRVVGGRNGLGAKLTNIFSKKFIVECCDGKQRYKQTFKDNMTDIGEPEIIDKKDSSYTKITYYPDYSQFDFDTLTEDLKSIIYKRCLDVAAYIPNVRISLNGKTLPVKRMSDYMKMHLPEDAEFFYEDLDNGWRVGVAKSQGYSFEQVSIVNGITTHKGGTHVNHISLQLSKDIADKFPKKIKANWTDAKNKLFLFLVCQVPNPTFDTQTKENLTNRMTNEITGGCTISDRTVKKIMKSEIVKTILDEIELREKMALKRISGSKKKNIKMDKLVDANRAGTNDSEKCHLFLCEGDSAVTMAVSGMSVVGRDFYGAFPLKGKVLNVRGASAAKIKANKEVQNLLNILGLQIGKDYEGDTSDLRYGKCVLMTDADSDGIHIKGLLMNFFETFFPSLLKTDFLYEFITPILKATKGKDVKSFYTMEGYNEWVKSGASAGYKIKYYKGLGTSTPKESKEYFKALEKHLLPFEWDTDQNTKDIDMVFNDKRVEDRKEWLLNNKPKNVEKYETPTPISSFIHNEMITFSLYDNIRSIPNVYDGLKPSQRKILNTCIQKNISTDTGVSDLAGTVKSSQKYHHGEKSLEDGIVNLAQDYVGSNNINILYPAGSFGSRLHGGKDAASPRYIYTYLSDISKAIFKKEDNDILDYIEEDGKVIEPETFKPIIPMALVNGVDGIGTGWSTNIPMYNPKDIIRVIENKLNDKRSHTIHPWFKGFKGEVVQLENGNYVTRGIFSRDNTTTITITELPVGYWTTNFIVYLNKLVEDKFIKDFQDNSTEEDVHVTINMSRENMMKINTDEALIKKFKLETPIYMTNMNLFVDGKITKFESVMDIIDTFFDKRLSDYNARKVSMLNKLQDEQDKLSNMVKFIKMVISDKLKINNRKKDLIVKDLESNKFMKIDDTYNYLLGMSIYSLTKEKVDELNALYKKKQTEFKALKKTSESELWMKDLEELKSML